MPSKSRVIPERGCWALFTKSYATHYIALGDADAKILHINPDKCTGCLQCEMACSFENYGTFATAKSRIKVFDFHETGKKVPYTCTQCDEAWCLHACPVEAITHDKVTGAMVVNEITDCP